jgi:alkanesulfonate monooxygenase SsuD/methylene tetrahydromethanopterin reductase-like flavin-dependent oxidoreductase (luciferase family)
MAERVALGIMPGTGWSAREIQAVAREAEDAGFDAIFTTEVNNDARPNSWGQPRSACWWGRGWPTSTCAIPTSVPREPRSLPT